MALSSREHLERVSEWAEEYLRDYGADYELHNKLCDYLKSALAEPPRNCDVGTPEEQDERFRDFCPKFTHGGSSVDCAGCECGNTACFECSFVWGNLPYKPEGKEA